jgi:hypothetical protein
MHFVMQMNLTVYLKLLRQMQWQETELKIKTLKFTHLTKKK